MLIADKDALNLSNSQQELVVSVTIIGAMVTAAVSGLLNDRYGRKPVIVASSLVFVIGAIVMAVSNTYEELLLGRLIVGLGVGASSMSVPVYVSEAAPAPIRGFLVTCVNVAITSGQFISSLIDGSFAEVSATLNVYLHVLSNGQHYMVRLLAGSQRLEVHAGTCCDPCIHSISRVLLSTRVASMACQTQQD